MTSNTTKLLLFVTVCACLASAASRQKKNEDFVWGTATAAYQIEGAYNIDGKGPNIWDIYTLNNVTYQNQSGQVAVDFYHRFADDIKLMAKLKVKHFRMSIAWSRVLPDGTTKKPNQQGIDFYNKVFDTLQANGITPWVTLYHWDLPAALNDKTSTGGWLNPNIVNIFNDYADFCFKTWGDRIKHWLTFNEIQQFAWQGYGVGGQAPGRCSPQYNSFCKTVGGGGDSSTEPYIAAHHALLAHALAVKTYRTKYAAQKGQIGMTIDSGYALPYDPSNPADVKAVDTFLSFKYGWLADPLVFGKYPDIMTEYVTGGRLPKFTEEQSKMIKGSFDFLGLNHYTSRYIKHTGKPGTDYSNDYRLEESVTDHKGNVIGPLGGNTWLYSYPQGIRGITNWIAKRYGNPDLYIFENGATCPKESEVPMTEAVKDVFRVNYLREYISNLALARFTDQVNLKGYFVWSLLDNYEWADGYRVRFGITYVDYNNGLKRTLKTSAYVYAAIIQAHLEGALHHGAKDQMAHFLAFGHHDEGHEHELEHKKKVKPEHVVA